MSRDPSDDDLRERLVAAQRRLAAHPAHQEHLRCLAFSQSINAAFRANANDLLQLLEQASTNPKLALELVQNVRPPVVREAFHTATTQRLHNYVAGTMTLVDHARRLMRNRTGSIADAYQGRKADLLTHSEIHVVHDLRNYMLHRTLPFLGHTLSFTGPAAEPQAMVSEVQLSVAQLLEWTKWSASSKSYFGTVGDSVALRPLVKRHAQLVLGFNGRLHDELVAANQSNMAELNKLVVERNAVLMGGADLATAAEFTQRMTDLRQGRLSPEDLWGDRKKTA